MRLESRKYVSQVEDILTEGGRALAMPLRRVAVGVVLPNPYAGRYHEDLTELIELGRVVAEDLTARCRALLGADVESYGKAGIVGEAGEVEHVAALLHPTFGAPVRDGTGGVSIMPSAKKRGAPGTAVDVPLHHKRAMLVRSHFDAVEFRIADAPFAAELVIALAVAGGGRPHPRVGGLAAQDVVGQDGLR
jgi:hypothetical protein